MGVLVEVLILKFLLFQECLGLAWYIGANGGVAGTGIITDFNFGNLSLGILKGAIFLQQCNNVNRHRKAMLTSDLQLG